MATAKSGLRATEGWVRCRAAGGVESRCNGLPRSPNRAPRSPPPPVASPRRVDRPPRRRTPSPRRAAWPRRRRTPPRRRVDRSPRREGRPRRRRTPPRRRVDRPRRRVAPPHRRRTPSPRRGARPRRRRASPLRRLPRTPRPRRQLAVRARAASLGAQACEAKRAKATRPMAAPCALTAPRPARWLPPQLAGHAGSKRGVPVRMPRGALPCNGRRVTSSMPSARRPHPDGLR